MKKIRKISLLASLLAVALLLSSCSLFYITKYTDETRAQSTENIIAADTESEQTSTDKKEEGDRPKSAAERARESLRALPDRDFNEQSFIIVTTSKMTFAPDGEDYYDRVLLQRDSVVEEKYNTDIITVYVEEGLLEAQLRNAALSETYYADMISVPEYKIGRLATEELILNLRSLPFYSTEYCESENSGASAAGTKIYADIGAASQDFSKIYAVFFNRDIADAIGADLESEVKEGSWTWESFSRYAFRASEQEGVIGQGSSFMGSEYTDAVFFSSGERLVNNTLGSVPRIEFNKNKLEEIVELTCSLIYGNPSAYKPAASANEGDFLNLFAKEQVFMAILPLEKMEELSAMNVNWGVVPIPKYNEEQERYCAYTEASANVIAVPSSNNKTDMTGFIIGALNVASSEMLYEGYKNNCLYNYFRDSSALYCMDEVLRSITFDFSFLYASGVPLLADATYGAVREARTSATEYASDIIKSKTDEVNAYLDELFASKAYKEN